MMKKYIIVIVLFAQIISAQNINKSFLLSAGLEYRFPDIYTEDTSIFPNKDTNIKGTGFNISISYNVFHNTNIGFSQLLKYSYYGKLKRESITIIEKEDKKLLMDYKFFIRRSFDLGRQRNINLLFGVSYMNVGSHFYTMDTNALVTKYNFAHWGYNFEVAYQYKSFNFGTGYYHIPNFMTQPVSSMKVGIIYLTTYFNIVEF